MKQTRRVDQKARVYSRVFLSARIILFHLPVTSFSLLVLSSSILGSNSAEVGWRTKRTCIFDQIDCYVTKFYVQKAAQENRGVYCPYCSGLLERTTLPIILPVTS